MVNGKQKAKKKFYIVDRKKSLKGSNKMIWMRLKKIVSQILQNFFSFRHRLSGKIS